MPVSRFPSPPHAHVPGRTPRHDDAVFAALKDSVRPGMDAAALAQSDAWQAGWQFLRDGYSWEAHEVWEPVWMALRDGSRERRFVQAAIQTANASLKLEMNRPHAVLRLCDMVEEILRDVGDSPVMATDPAVPRHLVRALRLRANPGDRDSDDVQDNA